MSTADLYGGHRVRVMWERPAGIWSVWPLRQMQKRMPIYVFIGYIQGVEQPLRICLRGDGAPPFVIDDPMAYDGGRYNHGPYANSSRYDSENEHHTLGQLFAMLHEWATHGREGWDADEQRTMDRALEEFYDWIWREHRRDREVMPALRGAD